MSKLLSRLSKAEILSLPGFRKHKKCTIRKLKSLLKQSIKDMGINFRGVRVKDYVKRFNEITLDNEIFNRISNMKKDMRSQEQYKHGLKENALFERSFMNTGELYSLPKPNEDKQYIESLMNIDSGYSMSKSEERRRYEDNVTDKEKFQEELKRMMIAVKNHESFEVDIGDDSEIQYAFTKVLRQIRKMKSDE